MHISTREFQFLVRAYSLFLCEIDRRNRIVPSTILRTFLVLAILPSAQYIGATLDNALRLPNEGKGLLEHFGQWAMFIAPPVIILLSTLAFRNLILITRNISAYSSRRRQHRRVSRALREQRAAFLLRNRYRNILILLIVLGAMISIVNFLQTSDPERYYGNDIFDSSRHYWGFLFTRINNCFLYTILFPVAFYQILIVSISANTILRALIETDSLSIDFLHEDQCGGMSPFGSINVIIMTIWGVVLAIIYADSLTHEDTALTLIFSLVISSGVFIAQSVLGVYSIHRCIKRQKTLKIEEINRNILRSLRDPMRLSALSPLMELRSLVSNTKTFPYTHTAQIAVNSLRLMPSFLTAIKVLT